MAKQPEERWATAASFADAVERALTTRRARGAGRTTATVTTGRSGPRRGWLAIAALIAAVLAVAVAAVASDNSSSPHHATSTLTFSDPAGKHRPRDRTSPSRTASSAATTEAHSTSTTPPTPSPASASALEARGHELMEAGDNQAAIAALRGAVAAADPSSLTYAYPLYDLGRSLRLAGDPRGAIQILRQRLQIPNQTGVVRRELTLAEQTPPANDPAGANPPPGPEHRRAGHGGRGPGGGHGGHRGHD